MGFLTSNLGNEWDFRLVRAVWNLVYNSRAKGLVFLDTDIDWLLLVISHSFPFRSVLMYWYSAGLLMIKGTVKLSYRSLT